MKGFCMRALNNKFVTCILNCSSKLFFTIDIQIIFLSAAIIACGLTMSIRLNYVHGFQSYQMNSYSYAQLAKVMSPNQEVHANLASEYLSKAKEYGQLATHTTDMFTASFIATMLAASAIILTRLWGGTTSIVQSNITAYDS